MSLVIRDLSVRRGDLAVIDRLDLEIAPGEFVALTGPSGCGKSTLLNAIAGLVPLAGGAIEAERGSLGCVFQRPMLLPWRTVLDNAAFGLECRGASVDDARSRARTFLEKVGLGRFTGYFPNELSEGMKQRLTVARAFLVEPRLVLMDEPFSSLDETARRELQDLVLDLWAKSKCTVLFVSHYLEELVYLADRVIVLGPRPTTVVKTVPVQLRRPRGIGNEGMLGLMESVQRCR
ncbi:MAG: ABC transporter ATP-binding protein [Elusimicrobia bacterium]|nr:ABC transporter ATP-binding protein [Elusimicrobiota bacterium]